LTLDLLRWSKENFVGAVESVPVESLKPA